MLPSSLQVGPHLKLMVGGGRPGGLSILLFARALADFFLCSLEDGISGWHLYGNLFFRKFRVVDDGAHFRGVRVALEGKAEDGDP